jgi:hypothetical protein
MEFKLKCNISADIGKIISKFYGIGHTLDFSGSKIIKLNEVRNNFLLREYLLTGVLPFLSQPPTHIQSSARTKIQG